MTSPSLPSSDLSPNSFLTIGAESVVASADRLGLKWSLRPASVSGGANVTAISLVLDGDGTLVNAYSLIGPLSSAARVMVMVVPPSGLYVIGYVGEQSIVNSQVFRYVPASPQSATGTTLTTLVGASFTFTKRASYSSLQLRLSTAGRATTAGATYAAVVAANFNGTPFEVTTLFFSVAETHLAFSHDFAATDLEAGDYTITLQARTGTPGKTYVTDQNDLTTLTVTEIL